MHLKDSVFTYRACGPFTRNKERIKKIKKQEIQDIFTEMCLIKSLFWTWYDFKDLARRTASDKVLKDKLFSIAKFENTTDIKEGLVL